MCRVADPREPGGDQVETSSTTRLGVGLLGEPQREPPRRLATPSRSRIDLLLQEVVLDELLQAGAERVLALRDQRGVRHRQSERVPEQRGDREPVGHRADHGRLGAGVARTPRTRPVEGSAGRRWRPRPGARWRRCACGAVPGGVRHRPRSRPSGRRCRRPQENSWAQLCRVVPREAICNTTTSISIGYSRVGPQVSYKGPKAVTDPFPCSLEWARVPEGRHTSHRGDTCRRTTRTVWGRICSTRRGALCR